MKTHALYADAIEVLGIDAVSTALGLSRSHTYRLARHPADVEDPDGTGARNDVDRIRSLMLMAAGHPDGQGLVVRWRSEFDALWRWLLRTQSSAVSLGRLRGKAVRALHELADVIDAAGKDPNEVCQQEIRAEALEARRLLDRIILACEQEFAEDDEE